MIELLTEFDLDCSGKTIGSLLKSSSISVTPGPKLIMVDCGLFVLWGSLLDTKEAVSSVFGENESRLGVIGMFMWANNVWVAVGLRELDELFEVFWWLCDISTRLAVLPSTFNRGVDFCFWMLNGNRFGSSWGTGGILRFRCKIRVRTSTVTENAALRESLRILMGVETAPGAICQINNRLESIAPEFTTAVNTLYTKNNTSNPELPLTACLYNKISKRKQNTAPTTYATIRGMKSSSLLPGKDLSLIREYGITAIADMHSRKLKSFRYCSALHMTWSVSKLWQH